MAAPAARRHHPNDLGGNPLPGQDADDLTQGSPRGVGVVIHGRALGVVRNALDVQRVGAEPPRGRRKCMPAAGLVHHSDRGSVYASGDYGDALTSIGAVKSMSRKGDCWDNRERKVEKYWQAGTFVMAECSGILCDSGATTRAFRSQQMMPSPRTRGKCARATQGAKGPSTSASSACSSCQTASPRTPCAGLGVSRPIASSPRSNSSSTCRPPPHVRGTRSSSSTACLRHTRRGENGCPAPSRRTRARLTRKPCAKRSSSLSERVRGRSRSRE